MKKRMLVVSLGLILVVSISTLILLGNNKVKYNQNKNSIPVAEKKKKSNKKPTVDNSKETSEEKKNTQSDKKITSKNNVSPSKKVSDNQTQNNVNKNNKVQSTPRPQETPKQTSIPSTPKPTQEVPAPVKPKTEWEKLGISEYEYYNTPLLSWEEVSYKNMLDCQREAKAINQKYGFVTSYGNTSGKYVDTIGCWVIISMNGNDYFLNEFRSLGY